MLIIKLVVQVESQNRSSNIVLHSYGRISGFAVHLSSVILLCVVLLFLEYDMLNSQMSASTIINLNYCIVPVCSAIMFVPRAEIGIGTIPQGTTSQHHTQLS